MKPREGADFVGWGSQARDNPEWNVGNIEIPNWDGGGVAPIRKSSPGYGAWCGFKKTDDPDRLDQLLRFADYIASPFGTQWVPRGHLWRGGLQLRDERAESSADP